MSKGTAMSEFNGDTLFSDKDIMQVAKCSNEVNRMMHKHAKGDVEQYLALVYEVGIMLTSQTMSCIENRNKMLPNMLKDVQRDLKDKLKFHDKVHKQNEKNA